MTLFSYSPRHPRAIWSRIQKIAFSRFKPSGADGVDWHSWDPHPWEHPWLTKENLVRGKEFSKQVLEKEKRVLDLHEPKEMRFGFCGNIANTMYMRAVPLRKVGIDVDIYVHPQDDYIMSFPSWEEFSGTLPIGSTSYSEALKLGCGLTEVSGVWQLPEIMDWKATYQDCGLDFLRKEDVDSFSSYLPLIKTLIALQKSDALWATQAVYLAYLANRPYIVSQSGGDIWFEASRSDTLGQLMRIAFSKSRLIVVSNPWTYAHARRYGFSNLVYMPKILDENVYCPGQGESRQAWEQATGGKFFVLTSSRLDEKNKGSSIGLRGFATFSKRCPQARLVLIGWGKDEDKERRLLTKLGIDDKVLILPLSGKALLRDYLRSADVFIDQFVLGYFGSAAMEGMACGLPVIGRINSAQYEALAETGTPPILNANSPNEVAIHLEKLYKDLSYRRELSNSHRRWLCLNHGSERWLPEYTAVLTATAVDWQLDLSKSPLHDPLSREEREYHAYGMAMAPPHPLYGW